MYVMDPNCFRPSKGICKGFLKHDTKMKNRLEVGFKGITNSEFVEVFNVKSIFDY